MSDPGMDVVLWADELVVSMWREGFILPGRAVRKGLKRKVTLSSFSD
jgi:hypothetical protein